jgi:hypothetical protein
MGTHWWPSHHHRPSGEIYDCEPLISSVDIDTALRWLKLADLTLRWPNDLSCSTLTLLAGTLLGLTGAWLGSAGRTNVQPAISRNKASVSADGATPSSR